MKRRIIRIFLALLILAILVQIPFIYRCYRLGQVAERIRRSNDTRSPGTARDHKGVIHVHSTHTGEIGDSFNELLNASCDNQLDFVLLTEHYSTAYDTSAHVLNGKYGPTLFVAGNEINTRPGDRFLMLPGGPDASEMRLMQTAQSIEKVHYTSRLAFMAYPANFSAWETPFDGIEVFNLSDTAREVNPIVAGFDLVWSSGYPALNLARYITRPSANLQKFDEIAARRHMVLLAGLDAHSGLGIHLLGDELGGKFVGLKLDPYERVFRIARIHIPADGELTRESLLAAIGRGSFFNGFDVSGDTTGFRFTGRSGERTAAMGDDLPLTSGATLNIIAPIPARIVVLKNGEKLRDEIGVTEVRVEITEAAAYRVEVYRHDLGSPFDEIPWILSNPIFVR